MFRTLSFNVTGSNCLKILAEKMHALHSVLSPIQICIIKSVFF